MEAHVVPECCRELLSLALDLYQKELAYLKSVEETRETSPRIERKIRAALDKASAIFETKKYQCPLYVFTWVDAYMRTYISQLDLEEAGKLIAHLGKKEMY